MFPACRNLIAGHEGSVIIASNKIKGEGYMATVLGFFLVAFAFLGIANNRQLARYFGGSTGSLTTTLRPGLVIFGMIAFCAGVAVIVLSNLG